MNNKLTRFLGDTPLRILVKLLVISLVVGIILSALDLTPFELWDNLVAAIRWTAFWVMDKFGDFGRYILYGAMVVVPIFLISRIMSWRR